MDGWMVEWTDAWMDDPCLLFCCCSTADEDDDDGEDNFVIVNKLQMGMPTCCIRFLTNVCCPP